MKVFILVSLFVVTSCASMNEEIKGYSGASRTKALSQIKGKTPAEAKLVLGEPAAEGYCDAECGRSTGVHQLVYLNKTLPRYSFALSMANKSALDCFIVYFYYDEKSDKHIYDGIGVMDQTSCSQDYGAIASVRKMQQNK
jgi:hypothetical protein